MLKHVHGEHDTNTLPYLVLYKRRHLSASLTAWAKVLKTTVEHVLVAARSRACGHRHSESPVHPYSWRPDRRLVHVFAEHSTGRAYGK